MFGGQLGSGGSSPQGGSAWRGFLSLLILGLVIYVSVFAFAFIYKWLWYAVPVFLIATVIVDRNLVFGLLRRLGRVTQRNLLAGMAAGAIAMFMMPFLAPVLLMVALFTRQLKRKASQQSDQIEAMFEALRRQGNQQDGLDLNGPRRPWRDPNEIEIDYEEVDSQTREP